MSEERQMRHPLLLSFDAHHRTVIRNEKLLMSGIHKAISFDLLFLFFLFFSCTGGRVHA